MTVDQESSPAQRVPTPVDGVEVLGAISPSRAADFMSCPLLYRFRTVDRLPEPFSVAAVRGTLVHKVLEDLFSLPADERTPQRAREMLVPTWEELVEVSPELLDMFTEAEAEQAAPGFLEWIRSGWEVLDRYFELEDPRRLEPADRELYVETLLDSKLLMRGYVDRLDVAPDGAVRVVDYKGLAVETPLPTPDGWTTMGEVAVGDQLIGADGRPTVVTLKSEVHHRPCYRVTLRDGSSIVCDNVHQWTVVSSARQRLTRQTMDSDGLYELCQRLAAEGRPRSLWLEAAPGLESPDVPDLPVEPWLLGAWLGDGSTSSGTLTLGRQDLSDMLTTIKERWGGDLSVRDGKTAFTVGLLRVQDRCTFGHTEFGPPTPGHARRRCAHEAEHAGLEAWNLPFSAVLRRAGLLGGKHIPKVYLRAGHHQRIDLLRGLMDTDGWWNNTRRRAGVTTTDDRLATDVLELLRSLGIHPQYSVKPSENKVRPGRRWHILEFTPRGFNPFSLPRKALAVDHGLTELQSRLAERRVIADVRPVPSVPTQCIAVDAADSLYLAGRGFIPTHNTGSSPGEGYEAKALFQMRFYALVIWRTRGVVPKMLQLIYLGNGEMLRYEPDEADLLATERKVEAIWAAIRLAEETQDWRPSPSRACDWCAHRSICPAWGGTPPPVPDRTPRVPDPADDPAGELTTD